MTKSGEISFYQLETKKNIFFYWKVNSDQIRLVTLVVSWCWKQKNIKFQNLGGKARPAPTFRHPCLQLLVLLQILHTLKCRSPCTFYTMTKWCNVIKMGTTMSQK